MQEERKIRVIFWAEERVCVKSWEAPAPQYHRSASYSGEGRHSISRNQEEEIIGNKSTI